MVVHFSQKNYVYRRRPKSVPPRIAFVQIISEYIRKDLLSNKVDRIFDKWDWNSFLKNPFVTHFGLNLLKKSLFWVRRMIMVAVWKDEAIFERSRRQIFIGTKVIEIFGDFVVNVTLASHKNCPFWSEEWCGLWEKIVIIFISTSDHTSV